MDSFLVGDLINHDQPHHQSYEALWNTRWRAACERGTYPFAYGAIADFEQISNILISQGAKEPYNWDEYASAFAPRGEQLVKAASQAEADGEIAKAIEFYLRASAVYRISRYPIPRSDKQWAAWREGKTAFEKGQTLSNGIKPISIPFGDKQIPVYANVIDRAPLVMIASGLDGYRTDNCIFAPGFARAGISLLVFEIPGTGDCPAPPQDPASCEHLMGSILDWCDQQGINQICLWGLSTGAGFALRAAHTLKDRLGGVVAQGGGIHHTFERAWLDRVDKLEYPFDLDESLAVKFGYKDVNLFKDEAQSKFSLVANGILDQSCTKTLLINGVNDTIFPIGDLWEALRHGDAKEARFFAGAGHMGEPHATRFIFKWIFSLFGCKWDEELLNQAVADTVTPIRFSL